MSTIYSNVPLPPSPPYSRDGEESPSPHLIPPNGISTPDRTPSMSSSFGNSPRKEKAGPSVIPSQQRRKASTSDGSSTGANRRCVPRLEDFQLIRVLGKGCAGRVLLVKHTPTNNIRAMKAISKRSVLTHDELNHTLTEQSILRRFAVDEPNNRFVSKLHNSFTDRENFYFVMDFYPGGDLATQMEIHRILGDHRTRFYAADITQGLEDLHRHGIIVRDLKPENILLNAKGHAVLADFGLSKEFSYRGDPKPIYVVTYPGQPELPPWAGQGAGSMRVLPNGQKQLMVDKAYSFVETSEYLSPEVVKRNDYSYAVDWWALGCIVLEGLVGRVPFRKAEEEPPMVLWNKILYDSWDDFLHDPAMASFIPDPVTCSFIDALLQKDPMWRLTEPCVKEHEYFAYLDWETVRRGEYQDPHGLRLHPVAEYNTSYFPKLCLEEDPSVDMSTHDMRYEDNYKKTPLNDNALYALEQAKYRFELESFAWSREEDDYETVEESEIGESVAEEEEVEPEEEEQRGQALDGIVSAADEVVPIQVMEDGLSPELMETENPQIGIKVIEAQQTEDTKSQDKEDITIHPISTEHGISVPLSTVITGTAPSKDSPVTLQPGSPESAYSSNPPMPSPIPAPKSHVDNHTSPEDIAAALLKENAETKPDQVKLIEVVAATEDISSTPSDEKDISGVPKLDTPGKKLMEIDSASIHATEPIKPLSPQTPTSPLSTHSTGTRPIPIPIRPKAVRQLSEEVNLNLPQGLPSSGLSVSDVVTIPSPHPGSPSTRIHRRHPQLPIVDTIPIARLSVELHGGLRTHIDDEEWEELIAEGPDASAPNGNGLNQNHSFLGLGRVLKRRPSNLNGFNNNHNGSAISNGVGSGLRRQVKNSDTTTTSSQPSSSASPTKQNYRPNIFSNKSISNTKKAFGKLKQFPKLKSITSPTESSLKNQSHINIHSPLIEPPLIPNSSTNSSSSAPSSNAKDMSEPPTQNGRDQSSSKPSATAEQDRPNMGYRRHTESGLGWLQRRKKKSSPIKPIQPSKSSSKSASVSKANSPVIDPAIVNNTDFVADDEARQDGNTASSRSVSVSKDKEGLPKLSLDNIQLNGLDWEPFDGKGWGIE
ncbi:uncharacterized protein L201_007955 [Kwoniella dendrophila CBS 6074]|uniref:non-specific serine/threonine protein kinase n=1 Tax=Kwoniella dendrophila CBS 6074 TaxID=1295534 RepID=A0AAX4K5T7_9TREE